MTFLYKRPKKCGRKIKMIDDQELINILYSCRSLNQLFEIISSLRDEEVLTKDELSECEEFLKEYEIFGTTNKIQQLVDGRDAIEYDCMEIDTKVKEFIDNRNIEKLRTSFSLNDPFSTHNVKTYWTELGKRILSNSGTTILDEDLFFEGNDNKVLSTGSDKVDEFSLGLQSGYVTAVIGDDNLYKSLWAINIAYQAIRDGNNVMYLSIGTSKENVAKRLITRHNCEDGFKQFTYEGLHNINSIRDCEYVIRDFNDRYSRNLVIYDSKDLLIPSKLSFRRLVSNAYSNFIEATNSGIDLIIVDDMTYLNYYNGKRTITDRKVVILEYYTAFKDTLEMLHNIGDECSILFTHTDIDAGVTAKKNIGNYRLSDVPNLISKLSDNILTIYGAPSKIKSNIKLKVIKSAYGDVMDKSITITADYHKWWMSEDDKTLAKEKYIKELSEFKVASLQGKVGYLKEQLDNDEQLLNEYRNVGVRDPLEADLYSGIGLISEEEADQLKEEIANIESDVPRV